MQYLILMGEEVGEDNFGFGLELSDDHEDNLEIIKGYYEEFGIDDDKFGEFIGNLAMQIAMTKASISGEIH